MLTAGCQDQGDFAFRNERIDRVQFARGPKKNLPEVFGYGGAAGFTCFDYLEAFVPEIPGKGLGLG